MKNSFTYTLTLENLISLAKLLAKAIHSRDVVALWGDLGTGKTTLARLIIQELVGSPINVPSPTFTLLQVYDCEKGEIWHCDLYRLKNSQEVFELGLPDAFHQAICLIEWPERLEKFLPQRRIDMLLKIVNETTREITITIVGSHELLHNILECDTRRDTKRS